MARLSNRRSHDRHGCPVLRVGENGEYDDGIHNGRRKTDKSCAGSIAAHPFDKLRAGSCKKRKDGPVQCKDGPPVNQYDSGKSAISIGLMTGLRDRSFDLLTICDGSNAAFNFTDVIQSLFQMSAARFFTSLHNCSL